MQRYIARRVLHSLLAILAMSVIVFSLARVTGNPLDVMLPLEAGAEDYERVSKHWGLDQPLTPSTSSSWARPCAATSATPGSGTATRPWAWSGNACPPPCNWPASPCSSAS